MDGQNVAQNSLRRIIYLSILYIWAGSVDESSTVQSNARRKLELKRKRSTQVPQCSHLNGAKQEERMASRRRIRFLDECGRNASAPITHFIIQKRKLARWFRMIALHPHHMLPRLLQLQKMQEQARKAHVQNYKTVLINAHKRAHFVLFLFFFCFLTGGYEIINHCASAQSFNTF